MAKRSACLPLSRRVCLSVCAERGALGARGAPLGAAPHARAWSCVAMADERLNQIFDAMDADKSGEIAPLEFIDHMLGT